MAKYLAQIIVLGVQVVGKAFAWALWQEFAVSLAEVDDQGCAGHQSAAASNFSGLSLHTADPQCLQAEPCGDLEASPASIIQRLSPSPLPCRITNTYHL